MRQVLGTFALVVGSVAAVLATGCHSRAGGPFDSPWSFTIEGATIDPDQANGDPWDPDLSDPDPYVVVYLNGVQLDRTPEIEDTLDPAWDYDTISSYLNPGDVIRFEIQDSDVFDNDIIASCDVPATASLLGAQSCDDTSATLDFTVEY